MNTQPKSKLLLIIIGILLVANLLLLSFFLINKPAQKKGMKGDKHEMVASFLEQQIGFSKLQLQQYDSLSARHHVKMKTVFDEMRDSKKKGFKQLTTDHFSDSAIVAAANLSAEKQKQIEIEMFKHFKDIRDLCTPMQQPKFDSLFYNMLSKRNDEIKR